MDRGGRDWLAVRAVMILAGSALLSCNRLPDIPAVNTGHMPAHVRQQIAEYRERAVGERDSGFAAGRYGMVLHAYRLEHPAEACYVRASELDAGEVRWPYYLGLIRQQQKRHTEAAGYLRRALALDPSVTAIGLRLADSLMALGEMEQARTVLEKALVTGPQEEQGRYRMGLLLEKEGKYAEAGREYEWALRVAPGYSEARIGLTRARRLAGSPAKADTDVDAGRSGRGGKRDLLDPLANEMLGLNISSRGHMERGVAYSESGLLSEAKREFAAILQREPDHFGAHANLLSLHGRMGQWEIAERHYRAAVRLNPENGAIHSDWANVLAGQEKPRAAAEAAELAVRHDPKQAGAHRLLGDLLALRGEAARAESHYRTALELEPRSLPAHRGLGMLLARRGRSREALPHLEKASALEGRQRIDVLREMSRLLLREGDRKGALARMRELETSVLLFGTRQELDEVRRQLKALAERGS